MVVKYLIAAMLFFFTNLPTFSFVPIPYHRRSEIEAGIELFLQENSQYRNYDAWEHYLTTSGKPISPKAIDAIDSLRKNNYSIDAFGYKSYILLSLNRRYTIQFKS
jgi:hypothetical protein